MTDDEWACLSTLFKDVPAVRFGQRGRPRASLRIVINAVLWILTTGEPWSRLPRRFPSGPTCRRRFAEWQLNGTLARMVQILSLTGRQFAFVPDVPSVVGQSVGEVRTVACVRRAADNPGFAHWTSPEFWQPPRVGVGEAAPADPFAQMTRQLTSTRDHVRAIASANASQHDVATNVTHLHLVENVNPVRHASDPQRDAAQQITNHPWRVDRSPGGALFADERGYIIHATAQPGRNQMFRAEAEIIKDGKRIERSGLVGPPFRTCSDATQYAFEWGQRWVDRQIAKHAADRRMT
ncbi:transposase [Paraburkholderia antibiotica]|uniref:Transposase n=1 Tax=Paraburkholderia antibiotica TaxID=2728839 RepID=A0A7X9X4P5_9BURK|nr:transposase [Paraburkholderia antibiotica]NML31365.1 transposase [Paraburkholderia antibiotica]